MRVKLTGFLNYAETPIEEAWARAVAAARMKVGMPTANKVYKSCDEPIILRTARNAHGTTEYQRWLNGDLYYGGPDTLVKGVFLETVGRYIDDITRITESVSFRAKKPTDMSINLNYDGYALTLVQDGNTKPNEHSLVIPCILREKGIEVPDGSDTDMLKKALRAHKISYESLFKTFLDELRKR